MQAVTPEKIESLGDYPPPPEVPFSKPTHSLILQTHTQPQPSGESTHPPTYPPPKLTRNPVERISSLASGWEKPIRVLYYGAWPPSQGQHPGLGLFLRFWGFIFVNFEKFP